MSDKERTTLRINGVEHACDDDPDTPLLYALRGALGLNGTRYGCGTGSCGACTVIVDGRAVQSCDVPVGSVAGAEIETVDGLTAADGRRHRILETFLDMQAAQCGYCIPGIVMSTKALLDANPSPSRDEIVTALEGHLCRCGAHVRIVRAIERLAAEGRAAC